MRPPVGSRTVPDKLPFATANAESTQQNKPKLPPMLRINHSGFALLVGDFTDSSSLAGEYALTLNRFCSFESSPSAYGSPSPLAFCRQVPCTTFSVTCSAMKRRSRLTVHVP